MNTSQIIILGLGFLIDLYFLPITKKEFTDKEKLELILYVIRTAIVWVVIITTVLMVKKLQSKNPCPEYEKIENVYRLK